MSKLRSLSEMLSGPEHHLLPQEADGFSVGEHEDADSSASEDERLLDQKAAVRPTTFYCRYRATILLNVFFLALHTTILIVFLLAFEPLGFHQYTLVPNLRYTPAREIITYETKKFDFTNVYLRNGSLNPDHQTKFFGPPSQELDDAWNDLIQYQNIHVPKHELGSLKDLEGLVDLADGSGYYATLSVYHSLHCVKQIHHYMYFDHYHPNRTEEEREVIKQHTEHCLDILRQSIQCQPDLTVFPMQWGVETRIPIGLDVGVHECVNWEAVQGWMKQRSFDVYAPGVVVHPLLGPSYPDGKGTDLGIAKDRLLGEEHQHEA